MNSFEAAVVLEVFWRSSCTNNVTM